MPADSPDQPASVVSPVETSLLFNGDEAGVKLARNSLAMGMEPDSI
jgi:hypothetical protein